MTKNDGGPAFPIDPEHGVSHKGEIYRQFMGMTLRDYFAGQALAGLLADPDYPGDFDKAGAHAYRFADAMLKSRQGEDRMTRPFLAKRCLQHSPSPCIQGCV